MVREARFAWDGDNPDHDFSRPDRFEELDDGFDDPLLPDERRKLSRTSSPPKPAEPKKTTRSDRRQLADADWLRPKRAPAKD